MEEKTLKKLEFNTVLQQVSAYAISQSAKDLILNLTPIPDFNIIKKLLAETGEAFWLINKNVIPSFNFDSVDEILKKAKILYKLTLRELLAVKRLLRTARLCISTIKNVEYANIPNLYSYTDFIYQNKFLEDELERCIINEEEIADDATEELLAIRKKIKKTTFDIKDKLNSYIKSATTARYLQDAIVTVRNDRYVLPVKQEFKANIQGLVHDQSASGATIFIEPISVVNLNNQLKELLLQENIEIEKIITNFTSQISFITEQLYDTEHWIAYLDSVFAKAYYAEKQNAILPKLNTNGIVYINKGRHPLIDKKKVVPISIKFGKNDRQVIITGPNTGGKTVTLKTVGLLSIMAYVGLYIPAEDDSNIAIFDNVFCDIGDEQSIEQNLSTFSSHVKNLNYILDNATSNTLVLIDEIGAGTEPIEGSALGLAVCEYLLAKQVPSLITTHYGQLKEFSITTPNVLTASMEFNTKTLEPTYKLIMGVPGNSNALDIAKRLGMKQLIIENALTKIDDNKKDFDKVLKDAEILRQKYEKELDELSQLKKSTLEEYEKAKNQNKLLTAEREKLLSNSRIEAKRIVTSAREEADELLEELKSLFKKQSLEESTIFKARSIVKKIDNKKYGEVEEQNDDYLFEGKEIDLNTLQIGDKVFVKKINKIAIVSSLVKSNKIEVKFNNMSMHIKQGEAYEFVSTTTEKPKINQRHVSVNTQNYAVELNIIGQTTDEGVYNVEKFLDEAITRNIDTVKIIHGRGTGKLKSAVHACLKSNKCVKEYRLGDYNEGNGGVTIVKLK